MIEFLIIFVMALTLIVAFILPSMVIDAFDEILLVKHKIDRLFITAGSKAKIEEVNRKHKKTARPTMKIRRDIPGWWL